MLRKTSKEDKDILQVLAGEANRRYYVFCDDFVILEDTKALVPILIMKSFEEDSLTFDMFKRMKEVCRTLFGDMFSLKITTVSCHCAIKAVKLIHRSDLFSLSSCGLVA